MNIVFWNVERLGESSSDDAKTLIANVVEWFFDNKDVEIIVLCEITSETTVTTDSNQDLLVEKVGFVKKKRKRLESAQLGYSVISRDDVDPPTPAIVNVPNYKEVFGFENYKKGGNAFTQISKRGVLELATRCDNIDVYFYHANSSAKSTYLIGWVAEFLRQRTSAHGYPFVLVGDLNCAPNEVRNELIYYDHPTLKGAGWSSQFRVHAAGVTHHARRGATSTLDFAVGSNDGAVTITSWNTLGFSKFPGNYKDHPDHFPIMLEVS